MSLFSFLTGSKKAQADKNPNLLIFFISLFIAGSLWIVVAFDKTYNTSIPLEIVFRDYSNNRLLKTTVPENPYVIANLRGWDIIKYKRINKKITLEIDMQDYENTDIIILSNIRKNDILSDLKILKYYPDTIHVEFEKGSSKLVVVKPILDIYFEKEYGLSGPVQVVPQKIKIRGAASVLRNIDTLFTEKTILKNVKSSLRIHQKVIPAGNNIFQEINEVAVIIPVDKYTEGEMILPVEIKQNEQSVSLIPDRVKIIFNSPVSNYKLIDSNTFRLYVELDRENYNETRKLKVQYSINNRFVFNVHIQPEFVDYVIKK